MQHMLIYNKGTYSKLVLTSFWHLTYNMHEDNTQIANLWMKKLEEGKSKVALAVLNYMCYSYWKYWKTSLAVFPDTDNPKLFSKWSSFVWSKHTVLLQFFFSVSQFDYYLFINVYQSPMRLIKMNKMYSWMISVNYTKHKLG